jgi:hypothetical protein
MRIIHNGTIIQKIAEGGAVGLWGGGAALWVATLKREAPGT